MDDSDLQDLPRSEARENPSCQGCCRISRREASVFLVYLEHFRSQSKSFVGESMKKSGSAPRLHAGHSHGSESEEENERKDSDGFQLAFEMFIVQA